MRRRSILTRLLAGMALVQICAAALAVSLVVQRARRESYAAFDARLGEQAAVLKSLVQAPESAAEPYILPQQLLSLPSGDEYKLIDSNGRTVSRSKGWADPPALPPAHRAYFTFRAGPNRYRALLLRDITILDSDDPAPGPSAGPGGVPTLTLVYAAPTANQEERLRRFTLAAVVGCAAILALSLGLSAWAVAWGLRPLRDLARRAARIDASSLTLRGGFDPGGESLRVRELAPLAHALTGLLSRLGVAFERERQFFGDAAHEMKTSVAIIKSTLQLALQSPRTAAEYQTRIQRSLEDTARLERLMHGMLDLGAMDGDAEGAEINRATANADVLAAIDEAIRQLGPLAESKGVLVQAQPMEPRFVRAPQHALRLVLSNLLENAIQNSARNGIVSISVAGDLAFTPPNTQRTQASCFISIADHGTGISESALPRIFERFYRGDASRSRATGGYGLGLAIARATAQRSGGDIGVVSRLGEGSTFTLRLPLAEPPSTRLKPLQPIRAGNA